LRRNAHGRANRRCRSPLTGDRSRSLMPLSGNPRRTVALKVVRPGLAIPEVLHRFQQLGRRVRAWTNCHGGQEIRSGDSNGFLSVPNGYGKFG
jgi:hypothetical protein